MAKKVRQEKTPDKQPHIAWRITRTVLDVLGKIVLVLLAVVGTMLLVGIIAGSIFTVKLKGYLETDVIPEAEEFANSLQLDNATLPQTSFICYLNEETGEERIIQQLYATQNRVWVSYDEIPMDLVNAAIAIEDKRFPEHKGVDWIRTVSAIASFAGGDASHGGSTITQQLIKNLTEEDDVTVNRKVQEIFRALAVEERYTKNEIIEWYLNTIYLGEGCYGVQSAAKVYFGKDVSDLTTAECASLIAITNNPSLYDPYISPKNNRERQVNILYAMLEQGYIKTHEDYEAAKGQELVFRNGTYDEETYLCEECGFEGVKGDYIETEEEYLCPECETPNVTISDSRYYSYYTDTVYRDVIKDLCAKYGYTEKAAAQQLLTGGYKIYCNIDPEVQNLVDRVYENLENVPKTRSIQQLQSAIIVIDNRTGDIVAMSGGVGEKTGSLTLNRATQSTLPSGSSFKPVAVYAPAFDAGIITPATVYEDSSFYDDSRWPLNDSRTYSGMCNIMRGVASSLNTISVKTLDDLGTKNSYRFLTEKLGFTTLVEEVEIGGKNYSDIGYAPLGLGQQTYGVTVREMTQAYATFANDGIFREARTYTRVVDAEGKTVLDNTQESHTAISKEANYYVNYVLQNAVSSGTGTAAYMKNVAVAGKTGTTSSDQDRWFAGYTPYYTAVVWCGFDDPEQIVLSGSRTNPAITMWNQVMKPLHDGLEYASFTQMQGVQQYEVCADCGMLATEACEKDERDGKNRVTKLRLFRDDAPLTECFCHTMVKICGATGLVANEYCELAPGNTLTEVGKLIYNEEWKVNKDEYFVYNPEKEGTVCTVHTPESLMPTEPPTESTTTPEPTEPTEPEETPEPEVP